MSASPASAIACYNPTDINTTGSDCSDVSGYDPYQTSTFIYGGYNSGSFNNATYIRGVNISIATGLGNVTPSSMPQDPSTGTNALSGGLRILDLPSTPSAITVSSLRYRIGSNPWVSLALGDSTIDDAGTNGGVTNLFTGAENIGSTALNDLQFELTLAALTGTQYFDSITDRAAFQFNVLRNTSSTLATGNRVQSRVTFLRTAVPAPLPLFGAVAAFGYSRTLRRRIKAASFA